VGLVTGTCLAHLGHDVTCVDTMPERVAAVNQGRPPFYEPGLAEMLVGALAAGRIRACGNTAETVAGCEITILAVGTPSRNEEIDLSYLAAAAGEVGQALRYARGYPVVAVKSTVIPGTTDTLVRGILERISRLEAGSFGLCMNPEFLREGSAVADFMDPDRIVIGQWDEASGRMLAELYTAFDCPKIFTTLRNAELTKYASNALLATLVSFSNEFAALCEATPGTDVEEVLRGLHLDRRLSPVHHGERVTPGILSYLRAGCGFGGSCLPKDVAAIRQFARQQDLKPRLFDAVAKVNEARPRQLAHLAEQALGSLQGATVAVLGLAFKPGTDDLRDSPALAVIRQLESKGATVRTYDPLITRLEGRQVCGSAAEALAGADAAIIVTAWPEFADYDWTALAARMGRAVLVDGRHALAGVALPREIQLVSIGRHIPGADGAGIEASQPALPAEPVESEVTGTI
jgi:UDPglucose 6-dehydrogenase/GDP-mannose 6-dehydrogenase